MLKKIKRHLSFLVETNNYINKCVKNTTMVPQLSGVTITQVVGHCCILNKHLNLSLDA